MSKENFKQAAEKLFSQTAHNVLWSNPKGEFFTSENLGFLSLKNGQSLTKHIRPAEITEESKEAKPLSASEAIYLIDKTQTLEELAVYETDERKTVKAAFELKLDQFVKANTVVEATVVTTNTQDGNKDTGDQKQI